MFHNACILSERWFDRATGDNGIEAYSALKGSRFSARDEQWMFYQ
jgi:hypothetical protein